MAPAQAPPTALGDSPSSPSGRDYTVVARRYRPQTFDEVIGQDHIVHALKNAIELDRVAQAYLFSGTRGVGKTSLARIFAKCLNCASVDRPTLTPCNRCDVCLDIAAGQDIDVIEIDGASNNGVDAVRELRQNAGLRPSRSRYKIYYIDEVHMLSTGAFNALLKTLEEPPSHVKFFFATTEANKIPITVLSRCQAFTCAGIASNLIARNLVSICQQERIDAEPAALDLVARRALGSLRDAQSLLERLLASGRRPLTLAATQELLGIAGDDRLLDLLEAATRRDAAEVLRLVDQAVGSGVQPTELLGGVLEMLRDAMILAAGAAEVSLLSVSNAQRPRLEEIARGWSLDTILAAQQLLAEARGRLRGSPYGRLLVELALCRVARLDDLEELSVLIARLDGAPVAAEKKKPLTPPNGHAKLRAEPRSAAATSIEAPVPDLSARLPPRDAWKGLGDHLPEAVWARLKWLEPAETTDARGLLVVAVAPSYNWVSKGLTELDQNQIETALSNLTGAPIKVEFRAEEAVASIEPPPATKASPKSLDDPLIRQLIALFEVNQTRLAPDHEASPPVGDD